MIWMAPDARNGETLYSVLARLGRYLQIPEAGPFMELLNGTRFAIASSDLPGNLSILVRDLPEDARDPAIDSIIDELTGFRFYTAFVPDEVRSSVRSAMRGSTVGIYTKLGLAAFNTRSVDRLRFCPDCHDDMEADFEDLWWSRHHQMAGIPVCHIHRTILRASDVAIGGKDRHSFVPATRDVCSASAPAIVDGIDPRRLDYLVSLTRKAVQLTIDHPDPLTHSARTDSYRDRLASVGLMKSKHTVDHRALIEAFADMWGDLPERVAGLGSYDDPDRSWLASLVRERRKASHPVAHLLLSVFLDRKREVKPFEPFGTGPWTCRNPAADHRDEEVIVSVSLRRSGDMIYGDFACNCGYLYTRARSPDGAVGPPRYRKFGPSFDDALRRLLSKGTSLRAAAAGLRMDPKTLMREAALAGIAVPWTTRPSGRVKQRWKSTPMTRVTAGGRKRRAVAKRPMRRNWFAIDARMERLAADAAEGILHDAPPVRVTFAEIERRIARSGWIAKRKEKLPRTVSRVNAVSETTDAYRHRRLDWVVQNELRSTSGTLTPSSVLRAAGLPTDRMPVVAASLAERQILGRWVA